MVRIDKNTLIKKDKNITRCKEHYQKFSIITVYCIFCYKTTDLYTYKNHMKSIKCKNLQNIKLLEDPNIVNNFNNKIMELYAQERDKDKFPE